MAMSERTTQEIYENAKLGQAFTLGERPVVLVVDFSCGFTDPECGLGADMTAEVEATKRVLDAARERLAYVEKELAPLADQQVADARRLGQLGDFNTLVLLEALKTAHEAKLEVLDARLKLTLGSRRLEALLEGGWLATGQKETQ